MLNTLLLTAWIGCQSLDLGTTIHALHSKRFVEGNPVMAGRQMVPVKVSVNVGLLLWYRTIPKEQRWALAAPAAASGCIPGALNLQKIRRHP